MSLKIFTVFAAAAATVSASSPSLITCLHCTAITHVIYTLRVATTVTPPPPHPTPIGIIDSLTAHHIDRIISIIAFDTTCCSLRLTVCIIDAMLASQRGT
jgi:hypothetical protein